MQNVSPADLKTILHSKRANLYYLEHCRVLVSGGRVEYITDEGKRSLYWNIPIANTTTVLLGTGTSVTQAAMRELAKAVVMVGFCGGGGTGPNCGPGVASMPQVSDRCGVRGVQRKARDAGHAEAWRATVRCAALASRYRQMGHDATPAHRYL